MVGSRGPKGGYRLSRERRKIKLSEIVYAVSKEKKLSKDLQLILVWWEKPEQKIMKSTQKKYLNFVKLDLNQ